MRKYTKYTIFGVALAFSLTGCMKDLDQSPIDPDSFTQVQVFANPTEAKKALAKIYASYALTGQQGPAGQGDVAGIDEGNSQFTRLYFQAQELTTETAVLGWADQTIKDFHNLSWSSSDVFINGLYNRLGQQISFANSFIANAEALSSDAEVKAFIAEARFLRAYSLYCLIDLYANVPLATKVQSTLPTQSNRQEIFAFIESELKAIEGELKAAKTNEYGRVDVVAAQALLSRLYLNAQTWVGTDRYADCVTYSEKVINSGYALHTDYRQLFMADNDTNGAQNEFIFVLNYDGIQSTTYGGTTFLLNAAVGGSMNRDDYGTTGNWAGLRTTKELVSKFEATANNANGEPTAWRDKRAIFYTQGQSYGITDISKFTEGYAVPKFTNRTSTGGKGKDPNSTFSDTDLPIIRLAEIYLNYAEGVVRSGGNKAAAVGYINQLRTRAGATTITEAQLTADFILDERARELYWEGLRRTDLIRYGKFTTADYLWTLKGGAATGKSVEEYRNVFPIPAAVLLANPNLKQNTGY